MFKDLFILISTALVTALFLVRLGIFSGAAPNDLGVTNNRLKAPSETENSVSSQAEYFRKTPANVEFAKIEPLNYKGDGKTALQKLKQQIGDHFKEAKLIAEKENYLRYEFTSTFLKFTDDVEFYLNENENYIHLRSASRWGRKDYGKNRARMEEIRRIFYE